MTIEEKENHRRSFDFLYNRRVPNGNIAPHPGGGFQFSAGNNLFAIFDYSFPEVLAWTIYFECSLFECLCIFFFPKSLMALC